jgi:subtilisin family serine protease
MKSVWAGAVARHLRACCLLAIALVAIPALAGAVEYIVEVAPGTQIDPLAAKYRFSIVKSFVTLSEIEYSVSAINPLSAADIANLASEPGVLEVETDATVECAEVEPSSQASASLQALGDLFASRATVLYYGSMVLASYVDQPGAQIIELSPAQSSFGAGWATVAIIDTGVDPQHPALSGVLAPGYDFTRDRPDTVS